jgi:hypothetical protein
VRIFSVDSSRKIIRLQESDGNPRKDGQNIPVDMLVNPMEGLQQSRLRNMNDIEYTFE